MKVRKNMSLDEDVARWLEGKNASKLFNNACREAMGREAAPKPPVERKCGKCGNVQTNPHINGCENCGELLPARWPS